VTTLFTFGVSLMAQAPHRQIPHSFDAHVNLHASGKSSSEPAAEREMKTPPLVIPAGLKRESIFKQICNRPSLFVILSISEGSLFTEQSANNT
jgi:hypothetical protein